MGKQVPLDALRHKRFQSTWCAKNGKEMRELLHRDYVIRSNIENFCRQKKLDHIRTIISGTKDCKVELHSLRLGGLLGKNKEKVGEIQKIIGKSSEWYRIKKVTPEITPLGVQNQELDADAIALKIASDMERGKSFNLSMKTHLQEAMRFGAIGAMIICSGRLNGNDIARVETRKGGKVPRKTIRANTFYGFRDAYTKSGTCGVKVRLNLPEDFATKAASIPRMRRTGNVPGQRRGSFREFPRKQESKS